MRADFGYKSDQTGMKKRRYEEKWRKKHTKRRISNFELPKLIKQNELLPTEKHLKGLGVAKMRWNLAQVCKMCVAGTILTGRKIRAVLPGETKSKYKEKKQIEVFRFPRLGIWKRDLQYP